MSATASSSSESISPATGSPSQAAATATSRGTQAHQIGMGPLANPDCSHRGLAAEVDGRTHRVKVAVKPILTLHGWLVDAKPSHDPGPPLRPSSPSRGPLVRREVETSFSRPLEMLPASRAALTSSAAHFPVGRLRPAWRRDSSNSIASSDMVGGSREEKRRGLTAVPNLADRSVHAPKARGQECPRSQAPASFSRTFACSARPFPSASPPPCSTAGNAACIASGSCVARRF